ncbi:Uncharacterised protein [Legionella steigerwaltii]|uniref:Uncharacterized protein n=1 Tax=Legionella steigerwaltii TaxID=460 RepID=A0A378LFB5_9GAMM|nr:hypothetical protein [Legionella steigerwaltii]KTD79553.1 hypothetical protein Lstg_0769 [Legionella steigerwaltii]STY24562.1 Uncharacterised protein [Legionella steigerwaltii]
MFCKSVAKALSRGGVIGSVSKVFLRGELKPWDPDLIKVGSKQVCRGMTKAQLNQMLTEKEITQFKLKKQAPDIEYSDIGRQVIRGGDPNLLSFSPSSYTASLYGANRYWLPRDGAIIVGCLPAVFTDLSEQAKACPQMCDKEQRIYNEARLAGGDYYRSDPLDDGGVAKLVMECNEICAVVGSQKGICFDKMYQVDSFVEKIHHVIGTGRPRLGLIPSTSCLVDTFINPDYVERALAVKIVLTKNPEHLEILEETMKISGDLEPDQRVLTADDAALIMGDPELRLLATTAAGPAGTTIVSSVPKDAYGPEMLVHLKSALREQIMLSQQSITQFRME